MGLFRTKLNAKELAILSRQIGTALNSGLPIQQTLALIGKQTNNRRVKRLIMKLAKEVETGSSLSKAMQKYSSYLPHYFVTYVMVGENSGELDTMFLNLASECEDLADYQRNIWTTLVYPIFQFGFFLVFIIVLPSILESVAQSAGSMEQIQYILAPLQQLRMITIRAAIYLGIFIILLPFIRQIPSIKRILDRFILAIPIISFIKRREALYRFCSTLRVLLSAAVPVQTTLELASESMENTYLIDEAKKQIPESRGKPISHFIEHCYIFPQDVREEVAVGEITASLDTILHKIAKRFRDQINNYRKVITRFFSLGFTLIFAAIVIYVIMIVMGGRARMIQDIMRQM